MTHYPFYAAKAQLMDFYNVDMNDDEFETIALSGWHHIGNKEYRIYKYVAQVTDHKVELPCNCDILESVHYQYEDFKRIDNLHPYNFVYLSYETFIEAQKYDTEPLYTSGALAKYTRVLNTLHFQHTNFPVTVVYKGVLADENGLPSLNFREVEAIAAYCAYTSYFKNALITKDRSTFELAQTLKMEWNNKKSLARVPEDLSQNTMDRVLDVISSWDRKRYGKSYKPVR